MHPIAQNPNAHSPTNSAGDNNSTATNREVPKMAVREFFFSFLSEADRKRTDQGWNAAKRRFDGFIRFVSTAPAKIRGDLSEANKALLNAAKRNDVEEVKRQIEAQAELNHADTDGMTAIMYAAQNGDVKMIRALTANGAAVSMRNKEGKTPLVLAMEKGHLNAMKYLIEMGADIECRDNESFTPLMYAVRHRHDDAVKLLLANNANAVTEDTRGWNALMLAASYNPEMAVKIVNAQPRTRIYNLMINSLANAIHQSEFLVIYQIHSTFSQENCEYALPNFRILTKEIALYRALFSSFPVQNFCISLNRAGIVVTQEDWTFAANQTWLSEEEAFYLEKIASNENLPGKRYSFIEVDNDYNNNKHNDVDKFFRNVGDKPSRGNALGLKNQGQLDFDTVRHSVDSEGEYRHAFMKLIENSPKSTVCPALNGLLLAGWRSKITRCVSSARMEADKAALEVAALLSKPDNRIELVDEDGKSVPMNSVRLKESLFSLALERDPYLNAIAAIDNQSGQAGMDWSKQAQAKAILELNKSYKRLGVRIKPLPNSASGANPVKDAVTSVSETHAAASLPQVDGSLLDADQLLGDLEALDSDFVLHWLISEIDKLPQKTHPQALRL